MKLTFKSHYLLTIPAALLIGVAVGILAIAARIKDGKGNALVAMKAWEKGVVVASSYYKANKATK